MIYKLIPLKWIFRLWGFWPPFFGAGISVDEFTPDLRFVRVRLKLRFWNRNYVGTQFGGSLFTMTDPIYMVMCLKALGGEYIVWDKSASIRFLKPGKTDVTAEFRLNDQIIDNIKSTLVTQEKMDWVVPVEIKDQQGQLIALVERTIYVRRTVKNDSSGSPRRRET